MSFVHFMQWSGRSAPNTISGYSADGIPAPLAPITYPWPAWFQASGSADGKGFKAANTLC